MDLPVLQEWLAIAWDAQQGVLISMEGGVLLFVCNASGTCHAAPGLGEVLVLQG